MAAWSKPGHELSPNRRWQLHRGGHGLVVERNRQAKLQHGPYRGGADDGAELPGRIENIRGGPPMRGLMSRMATVVIGGKDQSET